MGEHRLSASPALLPIYARAAITAPLHRLPQRRGGDTLPDSVYALETRPIDAEHLRDYQRVCGFAVSDRLPATYLHLLAFPLSMALMSESAFPFPLVGLVHVANSITVSRCVEAAESVALRVSAADLRPHSSGSQFDLLADASIDGESVWTSRSTYLRRGKPPAGAERPSKDKRELGAPLGAIAQVRVPGDIGRRYGAVSGDRNPIHLHPLTARLFGFPTAIAHGMWLMARTLATLEGRLPESYAVEVGFKLPVLLPSTVAVATNVAADGSWQLDVRDARSGRPHLAGRVQPLS
jgi:hypothetical protein